jgi:hypothetical protein
MHRTSVRNRRVDTPRDRGALAPADAYGDVDVITESARRAADVLNSTQCPDTYSERLIQICNARDALHHGYRVCRRVTALTRGRSATSHYLDSSRPHSAQQLHGPYHSLHRVMIQHISGSSPVCARRRASAPLITGARTHRRPGRSMHGIDTTRCRRAQ